MFDVAIAYRVYPKFGRNAYKSDAWDKYRLSEVCLKSFLRSLSGVKFKIFAILDGCPTRYADLFASLIPSDCLEITGLPGIGNSRTFDEQLRILLAQDDSENVYFAEDDYFYLDNTFSEMLKLLIAENVDFLTPYDHPDYYRNGADPGKPKYVAELHHYKSAIRFEDRHWRTVSSTCCTFLTAKSTLMEACGYFKLYPKVGDHVMWLTITKLRRPCYNRSMTPTAYSLALIRSLVGRSFRLWSPMPSIATHMAKQHFAPGIDWEALIKRYA
jgi:hypothetical protein